MQHLPGFSALAACYEGFIVDLWGVIHDGVTPYDGAVDCLEKLRVMGKKVVLLSNAPRRANVAQAALQAMGISDRLYHGIMTSGEAVCLMLRERSDQWFASLGRRAYHLGPERDRNILDNTAIDIASRPALADWVLNTGPDDLRAPTSIAEYEAELRECLAARLPMLCANPDLEVIRGGRRLLCAGALAEHYAAWGGDVRMIGKPDLAIYQPTMQMLGLQHRQVLAVGDALRTDIAGAQVAGIDACWVLGGIHNALVGQPEAAEAAAVRAGLRPVASISALTW